MVDGIHRRCRRGRAAREVAELAVSRQRLRFTADLHDIVGQRLGELAEHSSAIRGPLVGSGDDMTPVVREMEDVELVARRAMVEVADVAGGYAGRSYADQLGSAMRLLWSAGVHVTYEAGEAVLTEPVDTLLGYIAMCDVRWASARPDSWPRTVLPKNWRPRFAAYMPGSRCSTR